MPGTLDPVTRARVRDSYLQFEFPHVYSISLGRYKCTRRCRMCPMFNQIPQNPVAITDEIMERALAPIGGRPVSLEVSAFGETFTHPRADHYLFMTRRRAPNAEIVFVTNGSPINRERAEKIVDSGINVLQFSLDAGSPETYKWLTGSNAYDAICRNLEQLVEVRDARGGKHLKIQTHIIGIRELEHEFQAFTDRWSGVVDQAVVREYGNWAGRVDANVTPLATPENLGERYPCAWLWYATKIEPDGNVVKCHQHTIGDDPHEERLGNLLDQSFEEIWHGDAIREARRLHQCGQADKLMHCADCQVWSCFYDIWERRQDAGEDGIVWE